MFHHSAVLAAALALAQLPVAPPVMAEPARAIAMHGAPALPPGFASLPWVRPDAPVGGTLRLHAVGSFDSLNPFIIKGTPAAGLTLGWGLVFEPLMRRSADEPFTLYGLLAETAELPADRSWIEFTLDARARFSDGSPVTVEDVIWSWSTLREKGLPNARATWARVMRVEETGPRRVRFVFADGSDRELPFLVAGFLPVLPRARWAGRDFAETTLEPVLGSGPYVIDRVEPGRSIALRRHADWWGAALPVNRGQFNFAELRFDYFRDGAIALEAFKAGDVDFRIEPDAARWAEQYDVPAVRDGRIRREVQQHGTPSGLDALVLNLRRKLFADRRVRQALGLALDFEWINATLLHGGFARTASMFDNSALAPTAPPDAAELALLEPWRGKVPDEVFGPPWRPFASDGSGRDRRPLREAARLLEEAGWTVKDGMLANAAGQPFAFEIVLRDPAHEKIALAWARNLKRLGIDLRLRLVESAQFQSLIEGYDYDATFGFWGVTLSPGNEQQNYWGSVVADAPGGRNWAGVADPAVDAMIAALTGATTREDLVTAARALDRLLMWNAWTIPLWHTPGIRVAWWRDRLAMPGRVPAYGPQINAFWSPAAN